MKIVIAFSILIAFLSQTLTKVARINQYVEEAQVAYAQKDFTTAIYLYQYLNDSLRVHDREIKINLAHAYFQKQKNYEARKNYQPLLAKTTPWVSSLIHLQVGVIAAADDKTQALDYFKKALILNPMNEEARYNFELLKKYLLQHPEEKQASLPPPVEKAQPKESKSEETSKAGQKEDAQGSNDAEIPGFNNSDPENTPQSNQEKNNNSNKQSNSASNNTLKNNTAPEQQQKEISGTLPGTQRGIAGDNKNNNQNQANKNREESNDPENSSQTTFDHLKEAGITPEKARMLLEAMRQAEIQYLQQIPRKSTQKRDAGKPTW